VSCIIYSILNVFNAAKLPPSAPPANAGLIIFMQRC